MNRSGIDTNTVADCSGYPRKLRPAETSRNAAITTHVGWTVDGQLTCG
jgi:hypothetical protein